MPPPIQTTQNLTVQSQTVKEGCILPIFEDTFNNLKEVYSTAVGGHREWSNDVNLSPPKRKQNDLTVSFSRINICVHPSVMFVVQLMQF